MVRGGEGWPSRERLTTRAAIARVRAEGARVRGGVLEARVAAADGAETRVGVVVPKYGRSGVERNRLKRRLRELVRREWLPAWRGGAPIDVLVRALPSAYARSWDAIVDEMRQLARRVSRARPSGPSEA